MEHGQGCLLLCQDYAVLTSKKSLFSKELPL